MGHDHGVTIHVVPEGERETRELVLSSRGIRRLAVLGLICLLLLGVGLVSWGYLAVRAWEAGQLEGEVVELEADRVRVEALATTLAEVEAAYERLRALFGPDVGSEAGPVWLPPAAGAAGGARGEATDDRGMPTSWPLTQRGFLTQALIEGAGVDHPGIDVAIATGSYILAAGPGRVVEAAEDRVYGLYILMEHGEGLRTLYAHASRLFVEPGDEVERSEVIGLTGSTGRSTAPHLHFEILLEGEPVDPLTFVEPP